MIFRVNYRRGTIKQVDSITKKENKAAEASQVNVAPENDVFNFEKEIGREKQKLNRFGFKAKEKKPKPEKKVKEPKPKKIKEPNLKKEKKPATKLRKVRTVLMHSIPFLIGSFLLLFSGAVYAYRSEFEDTAFFGTRILGEDLGGKEKAEIQKILSKRLSDLTLSFNIDGQEVEVVPSEAGITFELADSAGDALKKGKNDVWYKNWYYSAASLIYRIYPEGAKAINADIDSNVEIKYSINDEKLTKFTENLSARFNEDAKNAGLVMKGTEVQVIPAVSGKKIMADSLKLQIAEALRKSDTNTIKLEVEKINPAIIEAETQVSIADAKIIISLPVVLTYQEKKYTPDAATIGGWVVFNEKDVDGKKKLVPEVDPKRVYSYVHGLAGQINVPVVNKKITVKNGSEQVVEREGKEGLAVDVDSLASRVATTLNSRQAVNLQVATYQIKYKTEVNNIIVADWAKYIEVNLSTQRMTAYLAGGEVVNSWAVTTGQNGMSTPTGTHLIIRKSGEGGVPGSAGGGVCMPNPPSTHPLCGINYVSTFTSQGHAIHEAWWRTAFGGQDYRWNGSHGCVNATWDIAKFIYYWAPIGTPVIVHY